MAGACRSEDGPATIRMRNGHDYTGTFPEIAKAARGFDNCIIDGEICAVGKDGLTDFSALHAAMKSDNTDKLMLSAFDLLFIASDDMRSHLMDRKGIRRTISQPSIRVFKSRSSSSSRGSIRSASWKLLDFSSSQPRL
jgi:ATP-dependent DNA ligase